MFSASGDESGADPTYQIRRIIDLTSPNRPRADETRCDIRYNRSIPFVCCPWIDDAPKINQSTIGITTDVSDSGLGLALTTRMYSSELLVRLLLDPSLDVAPQYFHTRVEARTETRLGFCRLGISIVSTIEPQQRRLKRFNAVVEELIQDAFGVAAETVGS